MTAGRVEGARDTAIAGNVQAAPASQAVPDAVGKVQQTRDAEATGSASFDALLDLVKGRPPAPSRSPDKWVADFIEPKLSDPTRFQGGRSLAVLERLASGIIPGLDESEELRSLAGDIIADEIERHRELSMRIHSGIGL